MVESVKVDAGVAYVRILLTVAGCPLKDKLRTDITAAAIDRRRRHLASRSTSA